MRPGSQWREDVYNLIHEALPGAEACPEATREGGRPDLITRWKAGAFVVVEIGAVSAPRIAQVEGQLARAVLHLNHYAVGPRDIPVAIVALNRYGPRLERAIRAFMAAYAPHVGWGLLDRTDKAVLAIPALGVDWLRSPSHGERHSYPFERRDRQLFTDLNRWMLKVLLLRDAPEDQWGGPRLRPRHPTDLAEIANVSVSKAHQFASAFQEEGYLRKSDGGLRLVRLPALLEAWLQDERNGSPKAVPARSFVPAKVSPLSENQDPAEPPLPPDAWHDVAIGGASAAMHRGLSRVGGRQLPLVHVGRPMSKAMHDWRLEGCDRRDAQMVLSRPLYPRSVFRGIVRREEGAPLVDLWQIALDAMSSAARGQEQAEYILERVIALQRNA